MAEGTRRIKPTKIAGRLRRAADLNSHDANEDSNVGRYGWLWLDSSSGVYFGRSAKRDVASCRPTMAPHLAPARSKARLCDLSHIDRKTRFPCSIWQLPTPTVIWSWPAGRRSTDHDQIITWCLGVTLLKFMD